MTSLTIALVGGLGAMFGWGFADYFAKVSIDDIGELRSLVWGHLAGTALLGIVAMGRFAGGGVAPWHDVSLSVLPGLALFGALQAAVYYLLYRGFGKGQVAVLSPTFASFSGLVALWSILFEHEPATLLKVVALVAVAAGILALSTEGSPSTGMRFFSTPGFGEVLVATAFATAWTVGWDKFIGGRDPISFAFAMYAFMTIALVLVARLQDVGLALDSRKALPVLFAIGAGEATAYISLSWAYSRTRLTSVVALISGAFSLPTIALASAFLRERLGKLQLVGAVLVIAGVVGLALA